MQVPTELDGGLVVKHTVSAEDQKLGMMFFEEKDGSTTEVIITGLAIVKYEEEEENAYYVFMCDQDWEVQDDYKVESVEDGIIWAEKNFDVEEKDWK
ncbi:MAG: hypothetical protein ABWX61_09730 [Paenisporosarcina sp.]